MVPKSWRRRNLQSPHKLKISRSSGAVVVDRGMSLPQRLHDGDGVGLVTSSRESIGSRKEEALRSEERPDLSGVGRKQEDRV